MWDNKLLGLTFAPSSPSIISSCFRIGCFGFVSSLALCSAPEIELVPAVCNRNGMFLACSCCMAGAWWSAPGVEIAA